MKKIRCFIIDDEPIARSIVRNYIRRSPDLELLAEFKNAAEAYKSVCESAVDILFLDIRMPGLTGTDFLRSLPEPPLVVFTTAYSEYAIEGFDLNIVDYLLKPITYERFLQAIDKIKSKLGVATESLPKVEPDFTFIKQDSKLVKVDYNQIVYVEAERDFCSIYLINEKRMLASMQLRQVEDLLPLSLFIRVHRSFIINLSKIKAVKGNLIEMANTEIPIGASFREQFFRTLKVR